MEKSKIKNILATSLFSAMVLTSLGVESVSAQTDDAANAQQNAEPQTTEVSTETDNKNTVEPVVAIDEETQQPPADVQNTVPETETTDDTQTQESNDEQTIDPASQTEDRDEDNQVENTDESPVSNEEQIVEANDQNSDLQTETTNNSPQTTDADSQPDNTNEAKRSTTTQNTNISPQPENTSATNTNAAPQSEPTNNIQQTATISTQNENTNETQPTDRQNNAENENEQTAEAVEQKPGQLYYDEAVPSEPRWADGEFHVHTRQSNDATEPYMILENILNVGFAEDVDEVPEEGLAHEDVYGGFDFIMTADHLRNSVADVHGNEQVTTRTVGIAEQVEEWNRLKEEGKYVGKLYYPGAEWDMHGLDHSSFAIIEEGTNRVPLEGYHEFEWLYAYDTETDAFVRDFTDEYGERNLERVPENAYAGLRWLEENYPASFLVVNHPSRHNGGDGEVRVEHIRAMDDSAPSVFVGIEGMPGNQMGGDRGEMTDIYGGADLMLAEVGGQWDSLLGEGRQIYNFANSDFHFKVSSNRLYSSGYWPTEYSRNYVHVEGNTFEDMAEGLKSGNSFAVYGDLIDALEFTVSQGDHTVQMGSNIETTEAGEPVMMTIRFRDPAGENNYSSISEPNDSPIPVTNEPELHHVDLIAGDIYGLLEDPTIDTNPTTRIVQRFYLDDFTPDENGFYEITFEILNEEDTYYRLRGTNHSENKAGETDENGNPLIDPYWPAPNSDWFYTEEGYMEALRDYHNNINNRNFRDLWFYSNPIWVYTDADDEAPSEDDQLPEENDTTPPEENQSPEEDENTPDFSDLEDRLIALEEAVESLLNQSTELEDQIIALQEQLAQQYGQLADQADQITQLEGRVAELKARIAKLEAVVQVKNSDVAKESNSVQDQSISVANLNNQVTAYENILKNSSQQLDDLTKQTTNQSTKIDQVVNSDVKTEDAEGEKLPDTATSMWSVALLGLSSLLSGLGITKFKKD